MIGLSIGFLALTTTQCVEPAIPSVPESISTTAAMKAAQVQISEYLSESWLYMGCLYEGTDDGTASVQDIASIDASASAHMARREAYVTAVRAKISAFSAP